MLRKNSYRFKKLDPKGKLKVYAEGKNPNTEGIFGKFLKGGPGLIQRGKNLINKWFDKNKFNERVLASDISHYSYDGECSWFDFAKEIVDILQIDCNLSRITSDDYPQLAKRPKYSVLSKKKISEEFNLSINDWNDSLKQCLNNLKLSNNKLYINGKNSYYHS